MSTDPSVECDGDDATLRIKTRQVESLDTQKKTFMKWINSRLTRSGLPVISDVFKDLRDGAQLLSLIGLLSGRHLKPERGCMRVHHLNNANLAIRFLEEEYGIKLVNISSDDIVDGNPKLTLGLLWNIILHWQVKDVLKEGSPERQQSNLEKTLLQWCQQSTTGYKGVNIANLTTSFSDGLAFNALLHHYCPELFVYDNLLQNASEMNLIHAFRIAEENFGIEKMLDPEDLMVDAPDKKSVMIYLMCCLQMLEKGNYSGRAVRASSSLHTGAVQSSDVVSEELLQESLDYFDQNVPLHQAVTDAGIYQKLLEPVVTWLLTAKEATSMLEPISSDVQTVKRQFQDHESFMESLTHHQDHVGRMLQRGHSAVQADSVSEEDRYQIEAQMLLLNAQWEELRIAAMDRQTSLQHSLTELQQKQLDQLHDWLGIMEGRVQLLESNASVLGNFQQQIEKHKEIQEEIGRQQEHVNSLHSMVVVVDDSNSDEAYVVLEHQLEELGQRWANVCLWAENHWIVLQQSLQNTICRRVEFSEKQSHFSDWLSNTSATLSKMPLVKNSDFHQLSEQIICLKNLEAELDKWMSHFDELTGLAEMLMHDDAESVSNLEPQLKLLHAEWDKIVQVMEEKSKEIMQSGIELKEQKDFDGSSRLTIVRQQESRDVPIGGPAVTACIDVQPSNKRPRTDGETESEVEKHKKYFHELRNAGESLKVKTETDDAEQTEERSIQQMQNLTKDIAERRTESKLLSNELMHLHGIATTYKSIIEKMTTAPVDSMENQHHLDLCKQNLDELKSYELRIQKVTDRIQSFLKSGSDELQLEKSLTDLNSHWADVVQKIGEHQLLMNESLEKTPPPYYFDAMGAFNLWIEGAEHILETEPFSLADFEVMDHRLQQFKSLHTDVLDHQKNYDYLWQTGNSLTAKNQNKELSSELNELTSRWNKLLFSVKNRIDEYDMVVEKLTVLEKIRELEKWTDNATKKTTMDFLIQSNEDITKAQATIKVMQDEIAKQSVCLMEIKKSADNMREDSVLVGINELPRALMQLEEKFLELKKLAGDLSHRFCTDIEAANELKALLKEEQLWLDQLELLLSKGPRASEDAEELSEELDELENFVGIRDVESNTHLEELAKNLIGNSVLSKTVAVDWSSYNQRSEIVLERAKMRIQLLEEHVMNAQNRESQILSMTQWMVEANDLIQSHLDADLLTGNVPKDYESLKSEFEHQEKILTELETDLTRFRKESKTDAAERLEQQIFLLKRQFAEVSTKFRKSQRPMDFESKMTYIRRILGEIEQQFLIDMRYHDPDIMQQQLSHCLNFYRTMSEIKSEVEHVIKTGRQIVEKKQVGFPNQLSTQIDAIKHQYNKLGTQITHTKSCLENMLKLAKNLNNELTSIQSFVDQTNDELRCRKNSTFPKDFQEELEWIEASEFEITRKQQTLVSLGDMVGQMAKLAEANSVSEPGNSFKVVTKALQDLKEQLGKQKSATQDELNQTQKAVDVLNERTEVLHHQGSCTMSSPLLIQLNSHLQQIQTKFAKSQGTAISSELLDKTNESDKSVDPHPFGLTEQRKFIDFSRARVLPNKSSAVEGQKVVSLDMSSQYILELETILVKVGEVRTEIRSLDANTEQLQEKSIKVLKSLIEISASMKSAHDVKDSVSFSSTNEKRFINKKLFDIQNQLDRAQDEYYKLQCQVLVPSDELQLWLTHADDLLSRKVNSADKEGLEYILHQIKNLETDIPEKLKMGFVLRSSERSSLIGSQQSNTIDIASLGERWDKVTARVVTECQSVEEKLVACNNFLRDIQILSSWVMSTYGQVQENLHQGPIDPKLLIETIDSRQPQFDRIVSFYESAESESQELSVFIPEEVTQTVQILGLNWLKLKSMMINDVSDVSCMFEKKLADVGSLSPSTAQEKLFTEEALSEISLSRAEITESPENQFYKGAASNLDRFLANLRNFMGLMLDKSKPMQVLIGDVLEIEAAIKKEKMKLIELEAMKPHIAALAEKSEMSNKDASEQDMKLLTDSIECLSCEWESSVKSVDGRLKELENMLTDCQAFDQTRLEFIVWMSEIKVALNKLPDSYPLDAELQEIQNLQSKVTNHRSSFDQLDKTGKKLVETYIRDDPAKIQAMIEDVKQMWTELLTRSRLGFGVNINTLTLWIEAKSAELSSHQPVISDLAAIQSQNERHQVLKGELEVWQNRIEETLKVAGIRQEMEELSVIQNGDLQEEKNVKVLAESLRRKWNDLKRMSEKWQNELDESFEKMILMQEAVGDLTQHLNEVEKEMAEWTPVHDIHVENLQQQINHTQIFQQKTAPIQGEVDQCIDMAAQFSDKKFSTLDDLVTRWQNLQNVIETRLLKLQESLRHFGPSSQHTLSDSVTLPWERGVAANKVPYYINHESRKTCWYHPEMSALMNSLTAFNDVRFSAYRTAMKLRRIQDQLHFDLLSLESVTKVFDQVDGLKVHLDCTVGTIDMIACLLSLYEDHASTLQVPLTVDLVLNWILNVFDSNRSGQVRLLSFKVALILMCNAHFNDKYRCLFLLIADVSGAVDQRRLGLLLHDCIQVPKQLGEIAAFGGSNIEPSVRSCFEKSGNRSSIELTHFMDWMKLEPQSMVWIPVMHRLKMAEGLRHNAKCTMCKATPISGLRYRCLKCFKFHLCQTCFFSGRTAKSHKLNHPMQEYSTSTSSGEDMRDFTKVFKNKFRSKHYFRKHPRLGYLPVQTVLEGDVLESPSPVTSSSPLLDMSLEVHSNLEHQANRLAAYEQKLKASKEQGDEHLLIVHLCQSLRENQSQSLQSPMQIIVDTDAGQKEELERMIKDLEADNQCLQAELDQLRQANTDSSVQSFLPPEENRSYDEDKDAELIEEARQLQHHKSQLEVRMKILEDHNRQLEVQLYRLRRLLDQPPADTRIIMFPSSHPVSLGPTSKASSQNSLQFRDLPSFNSIPGISSYQNSSKVLHNDRRQRDESEMEEDDLDCMLRELQESDSTRKDSRSKIANLFHEVEQINKAVGTLVTILTDEENSDNEEESLKTWGGKPVVPYL